MKISTQGMPSTSLGSKSQMYPKILISLVLLFCLRVIPQNIQASETQIKSPEIWAVRSIDTMKTSRDLARQKLYDTAYDNTILKELTLIKDLGANYVTVDTPYDREFYPYLLRWVSLARYKGLHVWFRGNWSSWEGWFDYPKNMTPQEHLRTTTEFIEIHPELFADDDAFDPCPECENGGFWKQPNDNIAYNEFVANQQVVLKTSFAKIKKNVHTNWTSIIGGRAKEVLNANAISALDGLVTIDHYVKTPKDMETYVDYFLSQLNSQVLIGEFGAPIPDINGPINQNEQAKFVDSIFSVLYTKKQSVIGINYFALSNGTTEIIDLTGNPNQTYTVIQKYFSPGQITGVVRNTLGDVVKNEPVKTLDGRNISSTNSNGEFTLVVPAESTTITVGGGVYQPVQYKFNIESGDKKTIALQLSPAKANVIYRIRLWFQHLVLKPNLNILRNN
jgi:hypothetical protein